MNRYVARLLEEINNGAVLVMRGERWFTSKNGYLSLVSSLVAEQVIAMQAGGVKQ